MKMRDELGVLYRDSDFVTLFRADCGQSALSPGQLALVSVMQFAEGLTDRQNVLIRPRQPVFLLSNFNLYMKLS